MAHVTRSDVIAALAQVKGPDFDSDIVTLGLVSDIFIADGKVFFALSVAPERARELEPLRLAAQRVVSEIAGVTAAIVTLTAEREQTTSTDSSQSKLLPKSGSPSAEGSQSRKTIEALPHPPRHRSAPPARRPLEGVRHVIAVASGKGGVGKSTTAINIALALHECRLKIGLLDGDIYGPSLPRLAGLHEKPEALEGKKLLPLSRYGLKMMSMGFLVDEETPMVWRGPMVMSAITQMLRDVIWAPLDILVVDMPPGTGDAHLTLAQQVPLSGSIIVSTPQDLALIDARKAIEMFTKVDVPILGLIENMSYFIAPDTGKRYDIFGHGGARSEAEKRAIAFLGEIPLDPQIRIASDAGSPIILEQPDGSHADAYRTIARTILKNLS